MECNGNFPEWKENNSWITTCQQGPNQLSELCKVETELKQSVLIQKIM